ncbi:Fur family transcriptional regulator [Treponema saccharophilum]|jgi:Fur family ferric uptake transcriptional regulator|uniref:Fur family transcriptional regulator n=1 Tax=Treponema saccharophilum TaxID=165 RepID=UPI00386FD1EA
MIKAAYKTRQQELLLSFLSERKGHFTAEDVRNHFAGKETPLGIATIYRQLERLVADGTLVKYYIDEHSAACFEYTGEKNDEENRMHFHIKCEKCGALIHLDCSELDHLQSHLKEHHGITLNPLRTVFYGTCGKCMESEE